MRFCINTWMYGETPIEEVVKHLSRLNYQAVEIPAFPKDPSAEYGRRISTALNEHGMEAVTVCPIVMKPPDFNINSAREEVRARTLNYIRRCIDLAAEVGCPIAVAAIPGPLETGVRREEALDWAYSAFNSAADYAEKKGVKLAIEHYPERIIETVDDMLESIVKIGSRNLFPLIDTGHLNITKEGITESVRKVGDDLIHVHLNNNDGIHDSHLSLNEGTLTREDFVELLTSLKDRGYAGYTSFEFSRMSDPNTIALRNRAFLEGIIREI